MAVVKVEIFDADTDTAIATLTDNATIPLSLVENQNLSIVATVIDASDHLPATIGSIELNFNNGQVVRNESFAPYALFGDIGNDILGSTNFLTEASHTISLTLFPSGGGAPLETIDIDFAVADVPDVAGAASFSVLAGQNDVQFSTFAADSFIIQNTGDKVITQVDIDISGALLPDTVFDPFGNAGDTIAKQLTIGTNTNTGVQPATIASYLNGGGTAGYEGIRLEFDQNVDGGFQPGETVGVSVDLDPNSIAGSNKNILEVGTNPPWDVGGVSGAELIGSVYTITFADGSTATGQLTSDGTQAGSVGHAVEASATPAPTLTVNGLTPGSTGTYQDGGPTVIVDGVAGTVVKVVLLKGIIQPVFNQFNVINDSFGPVLDAQLAALEASDFPANNAAELQVVELTLQGGPQDVTSSFDFTQVPNFVLAEPEDQVALGFTLNVISAPNGNVGEISTTTTDPIYLTYEAPILPPGAAQFSVTPLSNDVQATTATANSFLIENIGAKNISQVTIDISNALLPDAVFDPFSQAGDTTGFPLTIDTNGNTGVDTPSLASYIGVGEEFGYEGLNLTFNPNVNGGFEPGETIGFSIDADPNSIRGADAAILNQGSDPAWDVGSISGAELIGATYTVTFEDGSTAVGELVSNNNQGGAAGIAVEDSATPQPILTVNGITATNAGTPSTGTYSDGGPTVLIDGPAGIDVRVVLLKGIIQPVNNEFTPPFEQTLDAQLADLANSDFPANNAAELQSHSLTLSGSPQDISSFFDFSQVPGFNLTVPEDQVPLAFAVSVLEQTLSTSTSDPIFLTYQPPGPELTLSLSQPSISEDGTITSDLTIARNGDTTNSLDVTLTSDDTSELQVPSPVTIPAGNSSVTITLTAEDDAIEDGTQTPTITASATGFASDTITVDVTDDEPSISLSLDQSAIPEGAGPAALTGTVSITEAPASDLIVTLTSNDLDNSEISIPATVTILGGSTTATFSIDILDDTETDGDQTITIQATTPNLLPATADLVVEDDDTPDVLVQLIDATNGSVIADITDGGFIDSDDVGNTPVTISATIPQGSPLETQVASMVLNFNNGQATRTESVAPYALFGDIGNGAVYFGQSGVLALEQNNNITLTLFDGESGSGNQVLAQPLSLTFFVGAESLNDAPVAVDDTASTDEDTPIASIDVLTNDTDTENDPLSVAAASAANGTVIVNVDNTLAYTPDLNFNGPDTITYTVTDGIGGSDTATVDVTVNPVNDDPVADDETVSTDVDEPITIDVLDGDTDVDLDTLSVDSVSAPSGSAGGGVIINPDNTLTYTPGSGQSGTDTFTYTVIDGNGGSDVGTVNVTVDFIPPTLELEVTPLTVSEGDGTQAAQGTLTLSKALTSNLTVNISSSDTSAATVPASVTFIAGETQKTFDIAAVDDALLEAADQTTTITADTGGQFPALTETLTVTDDEIAPQLSVTITPPSFAEDAGAGAATGTVELANQLSYDLIVMVASADTTEAEVSGGTGSGQTTEFIIPAGGTQATFSLDAVDDAVFDTDQTFNITVSAFAASAPSQVLAIETQAVTVEDDDTPDVLVQILDAADGSVIADIADGGFIDSDLVAGKTITISATLPSGSPLDGQVGSMFLNFNNGQATRTESVTPYALFGDIGGTNFSGQQNLLQLDQDNNITLTLFSGPGGSGTPVLPQPLSLTFYVAPEPLNDAPVAVDDTASTDEDTPIASIDVLTNDTDTENDPLSVAAASAANGTVIVNVDNTLAYTPDLNFNGPDTITYTVTDGIGGSDTATVDVTVNPVNDDPVADDETVSTDVDEPITIDVLDGDTDVDLDTLSVDSVSAPSGSAGGGVIINPDNTLTYTPGSGQSGTDTFTYTVIDGNGGSDVGTVNVTVDFIPPTLELEVTPLTVSEGDGTQAAQGTLTLSKALTSNLTVNISSSDTSAATVPASVTFIAGETQKTFDIAAVDDALLEAADQTTTITADTGGQFPALTETLTVTDDEVPLVLTLAIAEASMSENGGSSQATVTRTGPTTTALTVALLSDAITEATVPATVDIPIGASSVDFTITAQDENIVDGTQTVTIDATAAGFTAASGTIDVTDDDVPLELTVTINENSISENGGSSTATVARTGPTTNALTVTLASNDTSEATVPGTVTIPAGSSSVGFTVTAVDDAVVDGTKTPTITASASGFTSGSDTLNVTDDDTVSSGGHFEGIDGGNGNYRFKIQIEDPNSGPNGGQNPNGKWSFIQEGDAADVINTPSQGSGYYLWGSNTSLALNPVQSNSILEYKIFVPNDQVGNYTIRFAYAKSDVVGDFTEQNDVWVNIVQDATGEHIEDLFTSTTEFIQSSGYAKIYGNPPSENTFHSALRIDGEPTDFFSIVNLDQGGFYTVQVAGRSDGFYVDYFELYKGAAPASNASDSPFTGGGPISTEPTANQISDFEIADEDAVNVDLSNAFSDADGDVVTLSQSLSTIPAGFTLDTNAETLTANPGLALGDYAINIVGVDDDGNSASNSFTITVSDDGPQLPPITVKIYDADSDTEIFTLVDGGSYDFTLVDTENVTVAAEVDNNSVIESVFLNLNNTYTRTESVSPFALFGDTGGDFFGQSGIFNQGSNTLTLDLYDQDGLQGNDLGTLTLDFDFLGAGL